MLDRIKVITSVIIIMVLLLGSSISLEGNLASASDGEEVDLSQIELPEKGNPKLDSHLNQLVSAPRLAASFAQKDNGKAVEETVRVIVECLTDQMDAAARAADDLGSVEASYDNLLQMTMPVARLTALADTPGVQFVRMPQQPLPAAVSEGVELINADDWHAASYNGTGVKVGILDVGFTDYEDLLGTELPASVTVKSFYAGSDIEGYTDHGTACAEIVYDIAPCADFYLANFDTDVEMGNAVDWLIARDVDVISCSIVWPGLGPGDGTGLICNMVKKARDAGILWSQAIGNSAQRHWQGRFVSADKDPWCDFKSKPFDEGNTIYVDVGDLIIATLNWDDKWGHSGNDYALVLYDNMGNLVCVSDYPQSGNGYPIEAFRYVATYTGSYYIAIYKYPAARAVNLNLYSFYSNLEYRVAAGSFCVPADSPYAMTMGAVFWNNPTTLEPFSSQGPTKDNRKKPDLVAPDGVSTATHGDSDGVPWPDGTGFFGTSASAPHGAGAAVLVKDLHPSFTPTQIQSFLESRAVPLGATGKDNLYGSGRLDLGPLPPEAPSGLTATAVSSTQIDLSWTDNSTDETGFKIERKTGSTIKWTQIATVGADATSYSSTKLKASTTYTYRIRAYNAGSNSDYCSEASAKTLPLPPPVPKLKSPTNKATAYRLTPSLAWNASKGASDYGLQVATDVSFTSLVINETSIADTYYNVTSGLEWNKTYYWRGNARNSSGSPSKWSAARYFTTAAGPPPEAPSGLTATPVSSTQIDLSWTDNSADETGFKIERKIGSTIKWTQIATVGAGATSYSNSKLKASTTYTYRIRAYNAANSSDYSGEAAAKTLPPPPPVPRLKSPKNNSTTDNLTPRLEWNVSKGASNYGLQVATDAVFASLAINETGIADTHYDITSALAPNTKYYWRVNARNSSGSPSKWSAAWYFTTPP